MNLHILTPVTRPENLSAIAAAMTPPDGVNLDWHVRFDRARRSPWGQSIKTELMHSVPPEDWVWICDDDNIPTPEFWATLVSAPPIPDTVACLVFSQRDAAGRRLRTAHPSIMGPDRVDIAQVVFRSRLARDLAIAPTYGGDSRFIHDMWEIHKHDLPAFRFLPDVEVGYNLLRQQ